MPAGEHSLEDVATCSMISVTCPSTIDHLREIDDADDVATSLKLDSVSAHTIQPRINANERESEKEVRE